MGAAIRAADVTIRSVLHVVPENLGDATHVLDEKAKAIVLLMRLDQPIWRARRRSDRVSTPAPLRPEKVARRRPFSGCWTSSTSVTCSPAQSQFDEDQAKVVFGPSQAPASQPPITVDSEGYLIAKSDFEEPVGPSFWERLK